MGDHRGALHAPAWFRLLVPSCSLIGQIIWRNQHRFDAMHATLGSTISPSHATRYVSPGTRYTCYVSPGTSTSTLSLGPGGQVGRRAARTRHPSPDLVPSTSTCSIWDSSPHMHRCSGLTLCARPHHGLRLPPKYRPNQLSTALPWSPRQGYVDWPAHGQPQTSARHMYHAHDQH